MSQPEKSPTEELRWQLAARTNIEIKEILKQLYDVSDATFDKLTELGMLNTVQKHPDYSSVEQVEHLNLSLLSNIRDGTIRQLIALTLAPNNKTMESVV